MPHDDSRGPAGLLERLGLHRPELRAWAAYDWANSAMVTVVVTAVFPIYYASVAARGLPPPVATGRYALATTVGLAVVALLAPVLGTVADLFPWKKRLLGAFLLLGAGATGALALVDHGEWMLASVLFVLANIGANGSFVFYDSLLPHVARGDELDRVSTAGYALGYLGGGLLLAFDLALIQKPAWFGLPAGPGLAPAGATLPARLSFLSVAAWWLLFSVPLFRRVPEPPRRAAPEERGNPVALALARLATTFRELRRYRQALLMLLAFLVYNDGIGTIIRMAAIYGTELGLGPGPLILAILLVQLLGIPFTFLFGRVAAHIGAKRAVLVGLGVYTVTSLVGWRMRSTADFFVLAALVAAVQGGSQALSRSLFASMIPRHQSGEFFGFFAVTEKFAGLFGPAIFAATTAATGSSRDAVLSVVVFFAVGAALLARVDVEQGQREARQAEREAEAQRGIAGAGPGGAMA